MKKMNLTHVRLLVRDFAACYRFYRDTMGLEVCRKEEAGTYAEFRAGQTILALFDEKAMAQALGVPSLGETRSRNEVVLCIAVDDVDTAFARLKRAGAEVVAEPVDRVDWGIRTAHFRDPDGTLIEINRELAINRELS